MIKLRHCREVDEDHKRSCRQYAHTYHYKDTICVAKAFDKLPIQHKLGLIVHEVGHILVGKANHKESQADREANKYFGVRILYKDSKYGKRLQYLDKEHKYIIRVLGYIVVTA